MTVDEATPPAVRINPRKDSFYSFKCLTNLGAGAGTYDDPLTMASAAGEWTQCEIIYVPYLEKYVIYEDYCAQCSKL